MASHKILSQNEEEDVDSESIHKRLDAFDIVQRVNPLIFFKNELKHGIKDVTAVRSNNELVNKCKRNLFVLCASRMLLRNSNFIPRLRLSGPNKEQERVRLCWMEFAKVNEKIKLDPIDSLFINIKQQSVNLLESISTIMEMVVKTNELYISSESFTKQLHDTVCDLTENPTKNSRLKFFILIMEGFNNILRQLMDMANSKMLTFENLKAVLNKSNTVLDDLEIRHKMLYANPNPNFICDMRKQVRMKEIVLRDLEQVRTNKPQLFTPEDIANFFSIICEHKEQNQSLKIIETSQALGSHFPLAEKCCKKQNCIEHEMNKDHLINQQIESQRISFSILSINSSDTNKEKYDNCSGETQTNQIKDLSLYSQVPWDNRRLEATRINEDGLDPSKRRLHGKIKCEKCGETFFDKYTKRRHVKSIHDKANRVLCSTCGKKFSRYDYMKKHQASCYRKRIPIKNVNRRKK